MHYSNPPQKCYVCGNQNQFGYNSSKYVNLREIKCQQCDASLRNSSLAATIIDSMNISTDSLQNAVKNGLLDSLNIYEVGAHGTIHRILKQLPGYVCSEYALHKHVADKKIKHENLEKLSFSDHAFNLVITQDVLEHVANYNSAFSEINRVLKKGGFHIFTVPLHENVQTRTRTTIYDYFLLPPIYHGDYNNHLGSLVYSDFGNDITEKLKSYNFDTKILTINTWYDTSNITNIVDAEGYIKYKKNQKNYQWHYNDSVILSQKIADIPSENNFTGERYLPSLLSPKISYEHLHRYLAAKSFVNNQNVLDIACGEGYGCNILSEHAKSVTGIDVDPSQIKSAKQKYSQNNIKFSIGSVEKIDFPDNHFDVVISFETIEHVTLKVQNLFLQEIKRVLKPDGLLIISTPNRYIYSDVLNYKNEFHVHEFYQSEFCTFLQKYFINIKLYGQSIFSTSQIWEIDHQQTQIDEELYQITPKGYERTEQKNKNAEYFIAICSNPKLNLPEGKISVFNDISHSFESDIKQKYIQYKQDYEKLLLENNAIKSSLREIEVSTSWKITKPLRHTMDFLKQTTIDSRIKTGQKLSGLSPYVPKPVKNLIKPLYHRIFSGVPINHAPKQSLDRIDPALIDNALHRDTMLDIFVWPVIDWQNRWQRPQQIISSLAKRGHRIFYFHTGFNPQQHSTLSKNIKISELEQNIIQVQLPLPNKLNIYQDYLTPQHIVKLKASLGIIMEKYKINHSVSIIHHPFWHSLVKELDHNLIVYDCMDDHSGFTTNSPHQLALEEELLSRADLVVATSQKLFDKARVSNQNVVLIRNGSDVRHFSNLPDCRESLIKKPIIGYYGAISDWFDVDLVADAARRYPDYSFVLIGSTYGADVTRLEKISNVHLLGEKPYDQLPSHLSCFDVCLIPFKINNLTLSTNPVKFYEYISAGKPVVSVNLPELNAHRDICYLSTDSNEFLENIKLAVSEQDNELVSKRKAVALANSWKSRVDEFEQQIFKLFPPISIITVSYNNVGVTRDCIESIYKYSRYPNFELIIVDNGSSDEAPTYLRSIEQTYPNLKIIYNQQNLGFAKANNQGVQISHGEYVIFLNNDTIVTNDWIYSLLYHIQKNNTIGLLGPVTNSIGNEQRITVDYENIDAMQKFAWKYCSMHRNKLTEIKMLALFCAIIKKDLLSRVGKISEDFGIGMFEDDDLCQKIKKAGFQTIMTEDVFIHHIGRASFSKMSDPKYLALFNQNKAIYEQKWGKWIPHEYRK